MIIPPDPEKDPRHFDPSLSRTSLASTAISQADIDIVDYPFGDEHALAPDWDDAESLPPYSHQRRSHLSLREGIGRVGDPGPETQRRSSLRSLNAAAAAGLATSTRPVLDPFSTLHSSSSSTSSAHPTSTHFAQLPIVGHGLGQTTPTSTSSPISVSKLWEGSSAHRAESRTCYCLPPLPTGLRKWWKRWRKWVIGLLVLALIGMGVVVGVLVGRKSVMRREEAGAPPWHDRAPNSQQTTWNGDGSFNLTYVDSRDGPKPAEGNITSCNVFHDLNITSSPFSSIFTPFTVSTLSIASFAFPINGSTLPNLFFIARGLGSSGTTTLVGSDGPAQITSSGQEGQVLVDVVVRYAGPQSLNTMMRVCDMSRDDGSVGVGIYSPTQTDGQSSNIFNLNPALMPTSHILIRLPPSAFDTSKPPIYAPSLSMNYDCVGVRIGDMRNVLEFGDLSVTSGKGGVAVGYAAMQTAFVGGGNGPVKGEWNVSKSIELNVTDSSITAGIILYDPSTPDNSSTLDTSTLTALARRQLPPRSTSQLLPRDVAAPSHSITSVICTTNGDISLSYLHHPPSVALSSQVATQQGNLDIHLHPTFVGPFAAKTVWGELFLPPTQTIPSQDPSSCGRYKQLVLGPIDTSTNDSIYPSVGITTDNLSNSTNTLSGVTYWAETYAKKGNDGAGDEQVIEYKSVEDVQSGQEGMGNQVVVLGAWGDVRVGFDGT